MINALNYLLDSERLLFNSLQHEILSIELDKSIYQLKVQFTTGSTLYIRYNRFGEYGYQLIFSRKQYDFVRWDNFDDHWPVTTKPHHFHMRNNQGVNDSQMTGLPTKDIPILIKYINNHVL